MMSALRGLQLCVCLLPGPSGEWSVTLTVRSGSQPLETYVYTTTINREGALTVRHRQTVLKGSRKIDIDESTLYSKGGVPISGTTRASDSEKRAGVMTVRYDRNGASVSFREGERVTRRDVPLPRGASMADPTAFWFIRDAPPVGKKATFAEFLPSSGKWVIRNRTYHGHFDITNRGKMIRSHKIVGDEMTAFVDDKELAYRIEAADGVIMERP